MSFIEKFNYNRDSITSGSVLGFTGSPIYGASMQFEASNSSWRGSNYNQFIMANGINSIKVSMDYYKNFSGSHIESYNVKNINNDVYEINLNLVNNRVSPILKNGMGFIADRTLPTSNSTFNKFDVVTGTTGSANSNVYDNYFYLTQSRGSSINQSNISGLSTYTGIAENSTRTFFWDPDQQVSVPISHQARVNNFTRSFSQQLNISRNQNRLDQLVLRFSNRREKEAYSILHFLESHLGYRQFVYYYGGGLVNENRVFYCPTWRHTFNYKDSNTIEATFVEIVDPITPEF
jgi:phage-related protein